MLQLLRCFCCFQLDQSAYFLIAPAPLQLRTEHSEHELGVAVLATDVGERNESQEEVQLADTRRADGTSASPRGMRSCCFSTRLSSAVSAAKQR
eukprot:764656-Hanusia_phi.AAC.2